MTTTSSLSSFTESSLEVDFPKLVSRIRADHREYFHVPKLVPTSFFSEDNGGELVAVLFRANDDLEGPPGRMHGGAIATLIDNAMGSFVRSFGFNFVTARLSVDYKVGVTLGSTVLVRVREDQVAPRDPSRRKVFLEAALFFVEPGQQKVLLGAESKALFVRTSKELITPERIQRETGDVARAKEAKRSLEEQSTEPVRRIMAHGFPSVKAKL
jgi:acyl-coenzyme A thioesterase PaaI-like protein